MNNQQVHREEMDNCVYNWLASHLATGNDLRSVDWVKETLRQQRVTTFLLIWPIMEERLFECDLKGRKIEPFSKEHADLYPIMNSDNAIDCMVEHFHTRFGGEANQRRNLLKGRNRIPDDILSFFKHAYSSNNSSDALKLHTMLYITHRYRNNIFHGSKLFESWTNVSIELDYCIIFMMRLVDAYHQKTQ